MKGLGFYLLLGAAALFMLITQPKYGLYICLLAVMVGVIQWMNQKRAQDTSSVRTNKKKRSSLK